MYSLEFKESDVIYQPYRKVSEYEEQANLHSFLKDLSLFLANARAHSWGESAVIIDKRDQLHFHQRGLGSSWGYRSWVRHGEISEFDDSLIHHQEGGGVFLWHGFVR